MQIKPSIFYAGHLRSPFEQQDKKLLGSVYTVETFDLSRFAATFSQMPEYLIHCFTKILPGVIRNDVVWTWGADYPAVPMLFFAKLFRKPMVISLYGVEIFPQNEIGYGFQGEGFRGKVARWLIRNADMNVVASCAYWNILTSLEPFASAWMIPGGVDIDQYTPNYATKELVAVTAYCAYKNSRDLKGIPIFEAAQRQSRIKMEVIHNRSHQTQIEAFLRAKVYCQLSYTESFGMSLLEAMACGCVPVVSNTGSLPEVVGNTGIIIPYGDPEAARRAVAVAIHLDGKSARARAAELFTLENRKKEMKNVITLLMNRKAKVGELEGVMER